MQANIFHIYALLVAVLYFSLLTFAIGRGVRAKLSPNGWLLFLGATFFFSPLVGLILIEALEWLKEHYSE